ncbi:MAG: hypothetical protein R3F19_06690 [Verrucomicrobiales bacterium]
MRDPNIKVSHDYYLEKFPENGKFYMRRAGEGDVPGGVFDGIVLEVGWSDTVVLAKIKRLYGGDEDGVYRLDLSSGQVIGPLPDETLQFEKYSSISMEEVSTVWNRMKSK